METVQLKWYVILLGPSKKVLSLVFPLSLSLRIF